MAADTVPVTVDNFIRAESDMYMSAVAIKEGGFGKFEHHRELSPVDAQRETCRHLHRARIHWTGSRLVSRSRHFLLTEWEEVVDAWQLQDWEAYRDVVRLGRKTRIPEAQRRVLWSIFERVKADLKSRGLITYSELFGSLADKISTSNKVVFDFSVVDEAQDTSVS